MRLLLLLLLVLALLTQTEAFNGDVFRSFAARYWVDNFFWGNDLNFEEVLDDYRRRTAYTLSVPEAERENEPDISLHEFLEDKVDKNSSSQAKGEAPSNVTRDEGLFADLRKCASHLSAEHKGLQEKASDILEDFSTCISSLVSSSSYSNFSDVVEVMFEGIDKLFNSLETNMTENATETPFRTDELIDLEERMLLDYIDSIPGSFALVAMRDGDRNGTSAGGVEGARGATRNGTAESKPTPDDFGTLVEDPTKDGGGEEISSPNLRIAIVAIIAAGCVGIVLVAGISCYCVYLVRTRQKERGEAPQGRPGISSSWGSDDSFSSSSLPLIGGGALVSESSPSKKDLNLKIETGDVDLQEVIGRGAFGVVYKGLWMGKLVAVKVLNVTHGNDDKLLKAFQKEVDVLSKLHHPNIVQLFGCCVAPQQLYIVEEYIQGGSLHEWLHKNNKPLSVHQVLLIAKDIANALSHLHPRVVHCDLKPQNILLDKNGRAKVADFGIAKFKKGTYVDLTSAPMMNGTPSYMAPELFSAGHVSEKCDIYSLGMLIWECVSRSEPWKELEFPVQVVMAVAVQTRRPEIPAECPKPLERLIRRCWSEEPWRRPSGSEIEKELDFMLEEHECKT